MKKIIDATWFTDQSGNCIGIVVIENSVGERKAYIGVASGWDEKKDEQSIADYGAPFYLSHCEFVSKNLFNRAET